MSSTLKLTCDSLTRPAPEHAVNENFHVTDADRGLFAVSHGVGKGADTASKIVVESVFSSLANTLLGKAPLGEEPVRRWLVNGLRAAGAALRETGKTALRLRDMSATLTVLHAGQDNLWHLLHVGDGRAYLLQDGKVAQLTNDHTLGYEQFQMGIIDKDALRTHPNARTLTRSISASKSFVVPDLSGGQLSVGQVFVLCSSGVTKAFDDAELEEILLSEGDPDVLAPALVESSETRGAREDLTVIVIRVDSLAATEPEAVPEPAPEPAPE